MGSLSNVRIINVAECLDGNVLVHCLLTLFRPFLCTTWMTCHILITEVSTSQHFRKISEHLHKCLYYKVV